MVNGEKRTLAVAEAENASVMLQHAPHYTQQCFIFTFMGFTGLVEKLHRICESSLRASNFPRSR